MTVSAKLNKAATMLRQPSFARALARNGVMAATEHLEVLRFCAARAVIDVGANKGQFSLAARAISPDAVIHAFEPLPAAADRFAQVFAGDPRVTLHRVALGLDEGRHEFHVASRADSSSLLAPGTGQARAYGVTPASRIAVDVRRLSSAIDVAALAHPILLKIDVQGAELQVLEGCDGLEAVDQILVELSFIELYEHQALFEDVRHYLGSRGFTLRGVFNQSVTAAFGPTQADCLFVNTAPAVR